MGLFTFEIQRHPLLPQFKLSDAFQSLACIEGLAGLMLLGKPDVEKASKAGLAPAEVYTGPGIHWGKLSHY